MRKLILTLATMIAIATLSFGQIKVSPGGDFCIGQNYSTNRWFKTKINGERKGALGLSTRHEGGGGTIGHPFLKQLIQQQNIGLLAKTDTLITIFGLRLGVQ